MRLRPTTCLLVIGILLVLLFSGGCAYNLYALHEMNKDINRLPRDSDTGVIKGTEAVTLPGAGPNAALLVHGFVGSRIDFNDLGPLLQEKGLTVRLLRLPGHGTYSVDQANVTNEQLIESVWSEYQVLKQQHPQVALIGFSMGGALSVMVAAEEPVDRLILIAPYFEVTYRWYYLLPAEFWNYSMGWAFPYVVKSRYFTCVRREEAKDQLFAYRVISNKAAQNLIKLGKTAGSPEILSQVRCPVLVLHSRKDRAASPKKAEIAFNRLGSTDKKFLWYENSDHHLLWDYDREEVKSEIIRFLTPLFVPKTTTDP